MTYQNAKTEIVPYDMPNCGPVIPIYSGYQLRIYYSPKDFVAFDLHEPSSILKYSTWRKARQAFEDRGGV